AAGVGFATARARFNLLPSIIAGWDAFAFCFLVLAWLRLLNAEPHKMARLAQLQPAKRVLILTTVLCGALASLASVGCMLTRAAKLQGWARTEHVVPALITVSLSWFLVHTSFALYYAYLFYRHETKSTQREGGLDFPETKTPAYADFAYFSFVIGMT